VAAGSFRDRRASTRCHLALSGRRDHLVLGRNQIPAWLGVIRNVSVPCGLNTPEEPNISSTRWRSVVDHKRKLYFFESALTPNTFWVDLSAIDFSAETGTVRMLDLGSNQDHTYSGNATKEFKNAKPFEFLGARDE
jgi:penicillin V acylase-like amidase (Ntn superfamily)